MKQNRFPPLAMGILFFIISLLTLQCKKVTVSDMLPPATEKGTNTFGVLVNDKPWTAGASPWGSATLRSTVLNSSGGYRISIIAQGKHDMLVLHLAGIAGPGTYLLDKSPAITLPKNSYDYSFISGAESFAWYGVDDDNKCCGCWSKHFITSPSYKGTVQVTQLDIGGKIMSGTFEITAAWLNSKGEYEKVQMTEGRFDVRLP